MFIFRNIWQTPVMKLIRKIDIKRESVNAYLNFFPPLTFYSSFLSFYSFYQLFLSLSSFSYSGINELERVIFLSYISPLIVESSYQKFFLTRNAPTLINNPQRTNPIFIQGTTFQDTDLLKNGIFETGSIASVISFSGLTQRVNIQFQKTPPRPKEIVAIAVTIFFAFGNWVHNTLRTGIELIAKADEGRKKQNMTNVQKVNLQYITKGDKKNKIAHTLMTVSQPNLSLSLVANKIKNDIGITTDKIIIEFVCEFIITP